MKPSFFARLIALWRAEWFSPKDFVRRAAFLALFYIIASLAGLREFTSILNGTTGSVEMNWRTAAFLGLLYVCIYLAFVLLVPMLLLAAALLVAARRFSSRTQSPRPGAESHSRSLA